MAPIEEKISSIASLMRNFSRSRERNDWFTYFLIYFIYFTMIHLLSNSFYVYFTISVQGIHRW